MLPPCLTWNQSQSQTIQLNNGLAAVNGQGDVIRGELVFKSKTSMCQTCHKVDGWGGAYGPDLTKIGSSKTQAQLINAILEPSLEMAPGMAGDGM